MALPTTRQLPYEPEKITSDSKDDHLQYQKKSVKEQTLMYEDIAKEHNALDARVLSLESTPPAHSSTHASGGSDTLKLDDCAAPDDNTDLNVSTSAHGLCPKLPNDVYQKLTGTGTWRQLSYVNVYNGSQQAIADGTWTKVQFPSENNDIKSEFDSATNYRFTATLAGYYVVTGVCGIEGMTDQDPILLAIRVNNAAVTTVSIYGSGTGRVIPTTSKVLFLAANDYVELFIYQNSGGALNTAATVEPSCNLTIVQVA